MAEATVGAHLVRLVLDAALSCGLSRPELALVHGLPGDLPGDDLLRLPTDTLARLWERLLEADTRPGTGARLAQAAPLGALGVWDYVIVNSRTVAEAFRNGVEHRKVISDPGTRAEVIEDGRTLTLRWQGAINQTAAAAANHEFVLSRHLWYVRTATGRAVTPVRVEFANPAPRRHRDLVELFGTDRVDFGARDNEISFRVEDAERPLPGADLRLGGILRRNAELMAAAARPAPGWLDQVRSAIADAMAEGELSQHVVGRRLMVSPRTLQRRLEEEGTGWREEVDAVRRELAELLLRDKRHTMQSVAARLAYADARALRKAMRRWSAVA
ncbi:transcriptional regulator [Actinoallomurus iriomotensis]|uniref:Transcriptional regulator n=1 Tax=Actinoallomurus iriomotensis TaxID=478107 RepID=A0A9W6RSK5_9ACTN|nr:transcriptional regulator [Actinoallomurus iriomotensis]